MTDVEPLFVDTNILIYANVKESPFHAQAQQCLQTAHQQGRAIWINRQIIREYLVTMTRPQAFPSVNKATALQQVAFFTDAFHIADETAEVTRHLQELIERHKVGGKQIHDTNIVATMLTYGITNLMTHNVNDFLRFSDDITLEKIITD